ncbi:MAG: anaphase promoting complex subunit 5 [Thelocarpon impressellum]|nr:MAG: anaphase promoting complex subunit 5 [Thelocarpon impressellum]
MARYLTPARVSFLALVALYADARVPANTTIPILSFVVDQLVAHESSRREAPRSRSFCISVEDFRRATIDHASVVPGRTVWDLLLKALWEMDSFDAMDAFIAGLSASLAKTRAERRADAELGVEPPRRMLISRGSLLGVFIRRAQLEYTRLPFHDAIGLWESFVAYREPTLSMWKKRNPSAGPTSFDVNIESAGLARDDLLTTALYGKLLEPDARTEGAVSTEDVEMLLEFMVEEMQKLGSRIPREMLEQFRKMIEGNVVIPSLSHYVRFLDSWRSGDYPSSFDNLHRYFDYTMHTRDRTFYQYALLNLAVLQADFGGYGEALSAMHEVIAMARENKDMRCLAFSLSWLYHFGKAHPEEMSGVEKGGLLGAEREGLAFLRTKAKETSMWNLWSTSMLSDAKLSMANGESIAHAFEYILKSSHLNLTMSTALGPQMLLQSSLWGRLGVTHLSWSYCELFLQCYTTQGPMDDVLRCTCRCAYILAHEGRFDEAFAMMEDVDAEILRLLKMHQYWATFTGLLKLRRALHKNDLDAAERLLVKLRQPEPADPDMVFETQVLQIELHARRGALTEALCQVEELVDSLDDESADVYQRVQLLTTKAHLLGKCGRPEKGFSVAMRAASAAWRARYMPVLWQAMAAIGNILVYLREFEAATQVLGSIMPQVRSRVISTSGVLKMQVLESEDAMLAAQTHSSMADAFVGQAGQATAGTARRKECLGSALKSINRSSAEYSRVGDVAGQREMLAKKAMVMHLLGEPAIANDCAAKQLEMRGVVVLDP